ENGLTRTSFECVNITRAGRFDRSRADSGCFCGDCLTDIYFERVRYRDFPDTGAIGADFGLITGNGHRVYPAAFKLDKPDVAAAAAITAEYLRAVLIGQHPIGGEVRLGNFNKNRLTG